MARDIARRFMLENADVRGEWVHLDDSWQEILKRENYPKRIRTVLGEALAAAVLLSATVKHQGSLILQIRGDGPVHLLVVQATPDGQVRGLARWSSEPEDNSLQAVFGKGQMVITLEAATDHERYQGIIALDGEKLQDALQHYFMQSEQLATRLWLGCDGTSSAGMLIQRLPGEERDEEAWNRVGMLLNTLTQEELLDTEPETLIYRLFHEEAPHLFDSRPVRFQCICSQAKIENTIRSLGEKEAGAIVEEQGKIEINCEFCNSQYLLDRVDVASLFAAQQITPTNATLH